MRLSQAEYETIVGLLSIVGITVSVGYLTHSIPAAMLTLSTIVFCLCYRK